MVRLKCGDCEHRKEIFAGMDCKGREKKCSICAIQPLASEGTIDPKTNEKYGYEQLYSNHLKRCSPKWCSLKRK